MFTFKIAKLYELPELYAKSGSYKGKICVYKWNFKAT